MKQKYIVLISIAICICTIILVIMQGASLRAAAELHKEDFREKMVKVLDYVVDNAEIKTTDNYFQKPVFQSLGDGNFTSFRKTQSVTSTLSGMTSEERLRQRFSISTRNIKNPNLDPKIAGVLEGSLGASQQDLRMTTDINIDDDYTFDVIYEKTMREKYTIDFPVEARVSKERIDSLIRQQFKEKRIGTTFEFAITSEITDSISGIHSDGFRNDRAERLYTKQMFLDDDFDSAKKYNLNIYVPHLSDYIFREMTYVVISSIVLILIIIGTFAATLIIIFRQKRLSKMRSDFMGNMTHELKTPIATITLAAEMLQDTNVPNEKKNIAGLSKMVRDESQRLSSLVEKVLRMAAFERGNIHLKHKDLDINSLVRRAVDSYALQFQSRGVKVTAKYQATNSLVVGDEIHLLQIISNLIDNALKYSKIKPEINISTTNSNNGIVIAVSDNGIGIDKEYQKHIFEQFYRVPTGNIHAVKGSGLGLNYVKQLAEMHGGRVWVESEKGKGSTFSIYLPNKN